MSKLIEQAKQARNRGSKRQVDIDAISNLINAYETTKQELSDNEDILVEMERKLKESEAECERLKKALGESINYRECNLNYTQALDALCKAELFYSN